jgi:hypothetical protein
VTVTGEPDARKRARPVRRGAAGKRTRTLEPRLTAYPAIVTDRATLARLAVPEDETVVEVPAALLEHLALDGLDGKVINIVSPIVAVTPGGHYIIQGKQVTDAEALSQMSIPDHETCVHVEKSAMRTLVGG